MEFCICFIHFYLFVFTISVVYIFRAEWTTETGFSWTYNSCLNLWRFEVMNGTWLTTSVLYS